MSSKKTIIANNTSVDIQYFFWDRCNQDTKFELLSWMFQVLAWSFSGNCPRMWTSSTRCRSWTAPTSATPKTGHFSPIWSKLETSTLSLVAILPYFGWRRSHWKELTNFRSNSGFCEADEIRFLLHALSLWLIVHHSSETVPRSHPHFLPQTSQSLHVHFHR